MPTAPCRSLRAALAATVLLVLPGCSLSEGDEPEPAAPPASSAPTYDGASHAINGEEPERIARDVNAFLQD